MFKIRNDDVIDMDKYTPIKKSDSEFKIEKMNGVDFVVLDSDNEDIENKIKLPSRRNLQNEFMYLQKKTKSAENKCSLLSKAHPSKTRRSHKAFSQQKLTESFQTEVKPHYPTVPDVRSAKPFRQQTITELLKPKPSNSSTESFKPKPKSTILKKIIERFQSKPQLKPSKSLPEQFKSSSVPSKSLPEQFKSSSVPSKSLNESFQCNAEPTTSKIMDESLKSEPKTIQEGRFAKQWRDVRRKLQSPNFKKKVVRDALLAYDKNGLKQKGPDRCKTPEHSEFIKSNPHFQEPQIENLKTPNKYDGNEPEKLSKYGYPMTPPRYWDIDFPSRSQQQELGMVVQSDSPLFKTRKSK